jgi:predicted RNA-binding Zn-ribbon protein involved in translation (DUF1610 family)
MIALSHGAVLPCPSCGHQVACRWPEGRYTADHQCPACGHVFEGTWPGFTFEPETVIARPPGQAADDDAA